MARTHGKVLSKAFTDDDWRSLAPLSQWLYWLLLGQPKLTLIGCMDYMPHRWASLAAGVPVGWLEEIVSDLEAADYVVVDRETGELLIRTFVRHDGIASANVNIRKGCWGAWEAIQSPILRKVAVDNMPPELMDLAPEQALRLAQEPSSERASERALQQASERAPELTCIPSPTPEPASVGHPDERSGGHEPSTGDNRSPLEQKLSGLIDTHARNYLERPALHAVHPPAS